MVLASRPAAPPGTSPNIHLANLDLVEAKQVPVSLAAAVAAALAEPDETANLLRGAKDAQRGAVSRLRGPLTKLGAAAALLLVITGFRFERHLGQCEADLEACGKTERQLWERTLPGEPYKAGELAGKLVKTLSQKEKSAAANRFPSALSFWSEVACAMPNPDQVGLSLESLHLAPDGGRMLGRVSRGSTDPLSNAALLESALSKSDRLAARGEFETRDSEIVVRLRLDYRPPATAPSEGAQR